MKNWTHQPYCSNCLTCTVRGNSVFSCLKPEEIDQVQSNQRVMRFKKGEVVFREGQLATGIYIITSGKLKIYKVGFDGREQIVRFAKDAHIVGYRSLLGKDRYTCTAAAIGDSELCFVPGDIIFYLLQQNTLLSLRFMKMLADDLKNAEENIMNMAQRSVRERVAEALLVLKDIYGFEQDGVTLNVDLSRDEFAGLAGTVRETATRMLSELKQDQIISLEGKKMRILNQQRLQNYCSSIF